MTKKLYSESNFGDIADAIRDKGGEGEYTVAEMGDAIRNLATSGDVLNGIIEQYKATTTTISANTFVEFVNGDIFNERVLGQETRIDSTFGSSGPYAIALGERVFIAYSSSTNLYGIVYKIVDDEIVVDVPRTRLSSIYNNVESGLTATEIDSTHVLLTYALNSTSLRCCVCSIGSTITLGSSVQLSSVSYLGATVTRLDDTRFFATYTANDGTQNTLYGTVCIVSGTTISVGTGVQLSTAAYSQSGACAVFLDTDKVLIAHRDDDNGSTVFVGAICTFNSTNITVGAPTQLVAGNPSNSSGHAALIPLSNSKFVMLYQATGSGTYGRLRGMFCSVSGTTITGGTETQLSNTNMSGYCLSVALLGVDENNANRFKIFALHRSGYECKGMTIIGDGDTLTVESDVTIAIGQSGDIPAKVGKTLVLIDNKLLCLYGNKVVDSTLVSGAFGLVITGGKTVRPSVSALDGLTASTCTTTTEGNVWVLDTDVSS